MSKYVERVIEDVKTKYANEPEFCQTVEEVLSSLGPVVDAHPEYEKVALLERMVIPERVIEFRVPWEDDNGNIHVNTGYRVQFNGAIGPYKGGLRFAPSVNLSIMKFLGFEQTFKDSLTTLPIGGAKGGSDFDPNGKSDREVMRFCQAFMTELYRHIGPDVDVPAGDLGVGGREIGYLFGQYRKLRGAYENGVLTGKARSFGGSLIRPEATGFGAVYYLESVMKHEHDTLEGKTVAVAGFGNVAWGVVQKLSELGAKPVTLSGPDGYIYDPDGIDRAKLDYIMELKNLYRGRIREYAETYGCKYVEGARPWSEKGDIALPSATQNELNGDDARKLVANGVIAVSEGANMPSTPEAIKVFQDAKILYAPGKAANAGGVSVSGLEMTQNSIKLSWSSEEVDEKLKSIMKNIHEACVQYGTEADGYVNYVKGANVAGFMKVAKAMMSQGIL